MTSAACWCSRRPIRNSRPARISCACRSDLVDVEDHLQYARRFYNGAVRELNDGVQRFPDLLIAQSFGFKPAEFFDAPDGAETAPKLELTP